MNVLERWVERLGRTDAAPDVVTLPAAEGIGTQDVYAGLAHLLASLEPADGLERRLAGLEGRLLSWEAVLHYEAFEASSRVEQLGRAARMQAAEVPATRSWLLPRLEGDLDRYTERAAALRALLEANDA